MKSLGEQGNSNNNKKWQQQMIHATVIMLWNKKSRQDVDRLLDKRIFWTFLNNVSKYRREKKDFSLLWLISKPLVSFDS